MVQSRPKTQTKTLGSLTSLSSSTTSTGTGFEALLFEAMFLVCKQNHHLPDHTFFQAQHGWLHLPDIQAYIP